MVIVANAWLVNVLILKIIYLGIKRLRLLMRLCAYMIFKNDINAFQNRNLRYDMALQSSTYNGIFDYFP